ncbi:FAD-binding protein [Spirosoma endophyticum]|uniref:FAD/FMN-containing dehydrogenase n=1 Tax=Spirosoma endophyticum TaxID=662367 RepID=A0A1I1N4J6_9BACT|nr:FAD-binding protein [Spirosoma endophyticum]SFC90408.1 FAD/FMN-containing dehydrogenase [Spirosoma endophyticum]
MIIHPTNQKKWSPRHETFVQEINNLFDLANDETDNIVDDYNSTTAGVQQLLQEAIQKNLRLRVVGGEWSFTKITATDGIVLNTKPLNISLKITDGSVQSAYAKTADDLYFSQCGVSVQELTDRLRKRKRSLMTSGASNGQTIAGALSTGTHGSAYKIGAIPEFVVGLHIIVSPTRHVWLERKSYPVVSDSFLQKIGAEPVRDDDLFKAALVSFGSFGFIHGVMIETVPLFLYETYRRRMPIDAVLEESMKTLDFTHLSLPFTNEDPYHFQVVINPYDLGEGAYVTTMYKRDYTDDYPRPSISPPGVAPGDDAPSFIGGLTQVIPAVVPMVVNALTRQQYPVFEKVFGTHGEIFSSTSFHGKLLSAAVSIPSDKVSDVISLLLAHNDTTGPFTGIFAFRYVKGTDATLGFTKFPKTCVLELDGIFSDKTTSFCTTFWDKLEAAGIPFAFHWGKMLDLTKTRLRTMYSSASVDAWIKARNTLMKDKNSLKLFTNDVMKQWGLDTILPTT